MRYPRGARHDLIRKSAKLAGLMISLWPCRRATTMKWVNKASCFRVASRCREHNNHHRHPLTNYTLFSVDTDHQISAPKEN
jgi:hypothetical protein